MGSIRFFILIKLTRPVEVFGRVLKCPLTPGEMRG